MPAVQAFIWCNQMQVASLKKCWLLKKEWSAEGSYKCYKLKGLLNAILPFSAIFHYLCKSLRNCFYSMFSWDQTNLRYKYLIIDIMHLNGCILHWLLFAKLFLLYSAFLDLWRMSVFIHIFASAISHILSRRVSSENFCR